ncbi:DUF6165 family protein [Sphingomonas spermidinifaciens]|uniref:DUF6165 family protein n=1 Tax=Sphingomonas spermidinifaciens TaxID=1141889 RepID=UPI001FE30B69|nr:DUF6165 family protein [Sphingomonas spermidinifaciens]
MLDKLTILDIKRVRLVQPEARSNVEREVAALRPIGSAALAHPAVSAAFGELRRVNERLWDIEDAIRIAEGEGRFGADFVSLARAVYQRNDERAAIKRRINDLLGSELIEEKSYASCMPTIPA